MRDRPGSVAPQPGAPSDVPEGWQVIGTVSDGDPTVTVDGAPWEGGSGWRHF